MNQVHQPGSGPTLAPYHVIREPFPTPRLGGFEWHDRTPRGGKDREKGGGGGVSTTKIAGAVLYLTPRTQQAFRLFLLLRLMEVGAD